MADQPRTWHEYLQYAVHAILVKCRAEGCTCIPAVDLLPSVTRDDHLEIVLAHDSDCPAKVKAAHE